MIDLNQQIQNLNEQLFSIESSYNRNAQEFCVGDLVWVVRQQYNENGQPQWTIREGTVNEVTHGIGNGNGGYYFYWIGLKGAKLSIWQKIRYYWRTFRGKSWNPPYQHFIGHAIQPGEEFFRTQEEAEKFLQIYKELWYLEDLIDNE